MGSSRPAPNAVNVEGDYRMFFWFMLAVIGGMSVYALATSPALRQPLLLATFTAMVLLHLGLHWVVGAVQNRLGWAIGYVVVQGALAFGITYLSGTIGMVFALFMALVGEAIGMWGFSRLGLLAAAFYLALSLINFIMIFTMAASIIWWVVGTLPTVVFVGLYVTLYNRQLQANEGARALLAELEAANRQLSEYAARVEDLTIVNERQRMARDLHDALSQGLAGLILQLEAADAHLAHDRPAQARLIVQQAMERARATLAEARQVIGALRNGQLQVVNLEEALRREAARFSEATGIPCEVHLDLAGDIPEAASETVLRAVAEALTNIARHARATQACLRLSLAGENLTMQVSDNGIGFDPAAIPPGHYGLLGLRERARLAGGALDIASQPAGGTVVSLRLPLRSAGVES